MKFLTGNFARILYAVPMIVFGITHFIKGKGMAAYVPAFFPLKVVLVYVTGLALILAGIAIILKIKARLASLLLALMLLIFIVTIHIPGVFGGQPIPNLLKDIGLMAGALLIAGIVGKD